MKIYWIQLFIILTSTLVPSYAEPTGVTSWAYQLQNYDLPRLIDFQADLVVIDFSLDGTIEEAFTAQQISQIRAAGKFVVSYISIGEAEDYRSYFDDNWITNPPSWMDRENLDWEGNYKVHYWEEAWQSIILDYIDKIIEAGFDGLYLDIVDGYEFYEDTKSDARDLMMHFVASISEYAKNQVSSSFLIIPQNGEALLSSKSYRSSIDGIGIEDLYVVPDEGQRQNSEILMREAFT